MRDLDFCQVYELIYDKLVEEEKKCLHQILLNGLYESYDHGKDANEKKDIEENSEEELLNLDGYSFANSKHPFHHEKEELQFFKSFLNHMNQEVRPDLYAKSIEENKNFASGVAKIDLRSFMNFTPLFIKIYHKNKKENSPTIQHTVQTDNSDDAIYSPKVLKSRKKKKLLKRTTEEEDTDDDKEEEEEDTYNKQVKHNPFKNAYDELVRRRNENNPNAVEAYNKLKERSKNKNSIKNNRINGYSKEEKKKKIKQNDDDSSSGYNDIPEPYWPLVDAGMEVSLVRYALSMKMDANEKVLESDIIGLDNIKKIVRGKIVNVILRPDLFTGLNRAAKGILLFGPPGTGKTMIAKWIASSCNCSFYNVNTSSLFSKYIGETEKIVTSLFKCAEIDSPSILFFDEIDSLMSARKKDEDDTTIRIKNQLLQMIDGINTNKDVMIVIIGATNRPDMIDDAALRRFNKRVYIPLPNFETRKEQIRHIISKYTHSGFKLSDEELSIISSKLNDWNGSDIYHLCSKCYEYVYEDAIEEFNGIENIPNNYSFRAIQYSDFIKAMKQVNTSYKNVFDYDEWSKMHSSL